MVFGKQKGQRGEQNKGSTRDVGQLRQFPTMVFYIENHENRFADRNALGERIVERIWTSRDNFSKARRLNQVADGYIIRFTEAS